jgi:hypothetical protein
MCVDGASTRRSLYCGMAGTGLAAATRDCDHRRPDGLRNAEPVECAVRRGDEGRRRPSRQSGRCALRVVKTRLCPLDYLPPANCF